MTHAQGNNTYSYKQTHQKVQKQANIQSKQRNCGKQTRPYPHYSTSSAVTKDQRTSRIQNYN